jgi:hypothetical protein
VACELGSKTTVDQLYIIERGVPHHSVVPKSQAIDELLENTEDAYGFPPYRYLAEALSVGGSSYSELRERERLILVRAMENVQIHRLGSDDFTWAEQISAPSGEPTEQKVPFVNLPNTGSDGHDFLGPDKRNAPVADPLYGSDS